MKGQLSHTRVPQRFMDHKYQELGRMERALDQSLYMKGFIPYHLPTDSHLPVFSLEKLESCWTLRFQEQRQAWARTKSETGRLSEAQHTDWRTAACNFL